MERNILFQEDLCITFITDSPMIYRSHWGASTLVSILVFVITKVVLNFYLWPTFQIEHKVHRGKQGWDEQLHILLLHHWCFCSLTPFVVSRSVAKQDYTYSLSAGSYGQSNPIHSAGIWNGTTAGLPWGTAQNPAAASRGRQVWKFATGVGHSLPWAMWGEYMMGIL